MSTTPPLSELKKLIAAGLHFGHKTAKWNPKMKPYIFGVRNGVHIFDLTQTLAKLSEACSYLERAASEGKSILLVSTKQQTLATLPDLALSLGLPYVTKWYGGLLTNWNTTKQRIRQLRDLKAERDLNNFAKYLKKERNQKMKEIERLEGWFAGLEQLQQRPDVLFVLDTVRDSLAVREANLVGIPVVGIADSNSDPTKLVCPIPANDDAVKGIEYILHEIHDAIERGQAHPVQKPTTGEKKAAAKVKAEAAATESAA